MSKVRVLYWDSDNICRMLKKEIRNGTFTHKVKIGGQKEKKTFEVNAVKPYWYWDKKYLAWIIPWGLQPFPMFVARHDSAVPHEVNWGQARKTIAPQKGGHRPIRGTFRFAWRRRTREQPEVLQPIKDIELDETLTPENLTQMIDQNVLRALLSAARDKAKELFIWLIIGAAIGIPVGIIVSPMIGLKI